MSGKTGFEYLKKFLRAVPARQPTAGGRLVAAPRFSRRFVLQGLGGVALALPFLEGLQHKKARAQAPDARFAIFFRQACGVNQASFSGELGDEPERFWPRDFGALTDASLLDRATGELGAFKSKLLLLRNVNLTPFDYGDGHAWGCLQGLTGRGPVVDGAGGDSEADGPSLDHRIGADLNDDGRESLVMYCGAAGGWLNGPSVSYRASGVRRTALHDPFVAYQTLVGTDTGLDPAVQQQIAARTKSVNDLVREQLQALKARPELSRADQDRLDLHLQSVRDLEVQLGCRMSPDEEAALEAAAPGFDETNGDEVLETARLHMEIAALAVTCGLTRSVSIQVGVGNDGNTRYRNLEDGSLMENYHFISHRRLSHDSSGSVIQNADLLHHYVDVQFAQTFRHLLEKLDAIPGVNGTALDDGVCVWWNDNAAGPPHSINNVPYILAGGCSGFFKQGQMIDVAPGDDGNTHSRLLNTLGAAVGVKNANGDPLDDFGDPGSPRGLLPNIMT